MKHIPVSVFGVGGVGRALLRQIVEARAVVAARNHCHFDIVAVADSSSWRWYSKGLSDDQLQDIVTTKASGRALGEERPDRVEILAQMVTAGLEQALVIDVTAADGMEAVLDKALALGYGVVLANKKPLAGPWEEARRYFGHSRLRYESTVGGGQPVIATLRYLIDTNDPIMRVEGQMSGTLGYICGRLDEGIPFSEALFEAKNKGYTEPDPRQDLGGLDVRRKTMILSRTAGWPLEEADIVVESLYHSALAHLDVSEFMTAAVAMDPSIGDRVAVARETGKVLRYIARVKPGGGSVGLEAIPMESPLTGLKYTSFQTNRYEEQPLMIGGRGAGVEMTAAGVLGDMIGLVRER